MRQVPQWLAALALLCACACARSAAMPTTDTLVVARDEDAISTSTAPPAAVQPEATTSAPPAPIKLTAMDVTSEVALRYARTAVVTRVRNPAARAQEATFRVLLPETAFISGFVMTLNGKAYKAYVKEKEEAKQIYNQAVSQGVGAAHIATKARDSNHFTVSVNVEPSTEAVFNLTYEELLSRRNGLYNQAINLHPGVLVPRLKVTVHVKEGLKITKLRVPHVRTGNEVDATEDDEQNQKAVIKKSSDEKEATITFEPDLEEQKRLVAVYAEKAKESKQNVHRPWYMHQEEESEPEGVLGQFVVQYDVDRPKDGEILVNDGYFVHFFAPPSLPPLSKHAVFVLDTSGSMMERKIQQLREAMKSILADLNPGDYFSIVEFSSFVKVHDLNEKLPESPVNSYSYREDVPVVLVPPYRATKDNVQKAQAIISRLSADGGTNIYRALEVALDLIHKGVGWTAPAPSLNDTADNKPEKRQLAEPSVNNDTQVLEPIIIFLTDGDPTVGETDPRRIISRLSEKNYGDNKATIFSLAFGEDADRSFLRKLSLRNDGFMRHIYEASDAALQLRDFYKQVSSPLLADVKFTYPPEQVKEGSLTKHKFRAFYMGGEAVVAGRLLDAASELTPRVHAFCGVDDGPGRKKYEIFPKVPVARGRGSYLPLERLWAYLTIQQLLDQRDAGDDLTDAKPTNATPTDDTEKPEKRALELALKYEFVTPLTSLVVVKPNATDAVDAESVDKDQNIRPMSFATPLAASYGGPAQASFFPAQYSGQMQARGMLVALKHSRRYSQRIPTPQTGSAGASLYAAGAPGLPPLPPPGAGLQDAYAEEEESLDSAIYEVLASRLVGGFSGPSQNSFLSSAAGSALVDHRLALDTGPAGNFLDLRLTDEASDLNWGLTDEDLPSSVAPELSTTPVSEPSPLERFRLQQYGWTEPFIDPAAGLLTMDVNGTVISLKLSEADAPSSDKAPPCARATDGAGAGLCVYLTRCDAARALSPALYAQTYCTVDGRFAGVCCPKSSIIQT